MSSVGIGQWLGDPLRFVRRLILVEPDIYQMIPWLGLLLVLAAAAFWMAALSDRRDRPPGLAAFLLWGPSLVFAADMEATVVWQSGLLFLFGWAASQRSAFAATAAELADDQAAQRPL